MKTVKILFSVLVCIFCFAGYRLPDAYSSEDLSSFFYSANRLYEDGRYEDAASEYEKILENGFYSGPLYYNLGNCYFKAGDLGKAVLYYEKANRIMRGNPELAANYDLACSRLKGRIDPAKKNLILRLVENISQTMPLGGWLLGIVVSWVLIVFLFALRVLVPAAGKYLKFAVIIVIALFLGFALCAYVSYLDFSSSSAVVLAEEVKARYGPGESSVEAFLLYQGSKIEIVREADDWYQIRIPDGKTGWIPKSSAGII